MRLPWSENLGGQGLRGLSPAVALSTPRSEELREVALCGLIAAVASALVVFAVPRGGDLAAHLYRTDLVRHGILVWDNLWFTGQYPLSSYSLLYYPLAALVGNATLGVAGVALSAGFFAGIARREWDLVGRWPARVFALLAVGQPFSAAYPYELGCAALLGTIWALPRRLVKTAVCCTLLSLAFSPLAFTSDVYRRWLRSLGVRYVVVPKLPLEAIDGKREARIVRDPATGFRRVWSAFDATIYELPHPTPILRGPGRATITDLDSNLVEGSVARPGRYALRLRFSPYELIRGNVCVSPSRTRLTRLVAQRPGRFVIQAIEDPLLVVATAFDRSATRVC